LLNFGLLKKVSLLQSRVGAAVRARADQNLYLEPHQHVAASQHWILLFLVNKNAFFYVPTLLIFSKMLKPISGFPGFERISD
jgi:hypothetical protein